MAEGEGAARGLQIFLFALPYSAALCIQLSLIDRNVSSLSLLRSE